MKTSTKGRTQKQIEQDLINLIGKELWSKYNSFTYGDMAKVEELEPFKNDLLQAEKEWFECE
jgi:hypothetical protein